MKTKALVVAVERPKIAANGHWLATVIYATTSGKKRKEQIFTQELPKLHSWVVINTARTMQVNWGVR